MIRKKQEFYGMRKTILSILVLFLAFDANAVEQCTRVYDEAIVALSDIQQRLENIENQNAYEESVKARFDTVSALLKDSDACEKPKQMDAKFIEDWQKMYMALVSLQATAQLCAFSGFSNWAESRQQDLSSFGHVKNVSLKL